MYPKNNETWQEMKARHKKDERFANKVAIIVACLILLPYVCYLVVEVMDKAAK